LKTPYALASKHINTIFHAARERVARTEVNLYYLTAAMIADILTKAFAGNRFKKCHMGAI